MQLLNIEMSEIKYKLKWNKKMLTELTNTVCYQIQGCKQNNASIMNLLFISIKSFWHVKVTTMPVLKWFQWFIQLCEWNQWGETASSIIYTWERVAIATLMSSSRSK